MKFTVVQKLEITEKELDVTKTLLTSTRIDLSNMKSTVDNLSRQLNGKITLLRIFVFLIKLQFY